MKRPLALDASHVRLQASALAACGTRGWLCVIVILPWLGLLIIVAKAAKAKRAKRQSKLMQGGFADAYVRMLNTPNLLNKHHTALSKMRKRRTRRIKDQAKHTKKNEEEDRSEKACTKP